MRDPLNDDEISKPPPYSTVKTWYYFREAYSENMYNILEVLGLISRYNISINRMHSGDSLNLLTAYV